MGIERGAAVIHPAQLSYAAAGIEHGFRESRFTGVHMGQNADNKLFHIRSQ